MVDNTVDNVNYLRDREIIKDEQALTLRRGLAQNRAFAGIVLHILVYIINRLDKMESKNNVELSKEEVKESKSKKQAAV
jgi:hypothetical protein